MVNLSQLGLTGQSAHNTIIVCVVKLLLGKFHPTLGFGDKCIVN